MAGQGRGLTPADRARAAMALGVDVPTVQTVLTVETGNAGGFLADGRPRILFEAHLFSRATKRRWDASHPRISAQPWDRRLYAGGTGEWPRLEQAASLDRAAALSSASWGLAQILGSNHVACGHEDVESFVAAMRESEGRQLDAFVGFIIHEGLAPLLRARAWAAFARRYNGPSYAQNAYDQKLAAVYADLAGTPAPALPIVGMLRIGMEGEAVRRLQRALNGLGRRPPLVVDGDFGGVTQLAVQQFQAARGLQVDGVVGPVTARALGL
ncbi:Putative peptidoglycan binding domain-containing protein [Roseomonas rosea]|uniref:Putative peptidoglycan binding domain-containing protein n=1 Tax=Muricoccus roseus TaxID=198092 RepID=A0A1M6LF67_9PROT|nr:N-acetylmuramidase domain-containing protein [Roseomonas rosea]SHJ69817.1 Putative peptidoglycan binding domain-containing protein [Roseomonas rosea]